MRWLIITTRGKNPGDEFMRIGIETLIRYNDENSEIVPIDRETPEEINKPIQFDKCIVAGMPFHMDMFAAPWWRNLVGWLSTRKNDIMLLGVGSRQPCLAPFSGIRRRLLHQAVRQLVNQTYKITVQDTVVNQLISESGIQFEMTLCPTIFSQYRHVSDKELKLVNIIPRGGRYAGPKEAKVWRKKLPHIIQLFKDSDFSFIAYNHKEDQAAQQWGFENIYFYSGDPLLFATRHTDCIKYFGNRIHGAIAARAAGADTLCCGEDTRLVAAQLTGVNTLQFAQLDLRKLKNWIMAKPKNLSTQLMTCEFERQASIVNEFMYA